MKVVQLSDVAPEAVTAEGACGVSLRLLISEREGAPNFALRLFEVEAGGCTPLHQHPWEHEVYILEGPLEVVTESGPTEVKAGDAVLISPGERHQFRSTGREIARFLCVIPHMEET